MNHRYSRQPDRQRGVALIVTLIMLAVITVLAVAFLALTRRETAAVDAMGRTTDAELACDSALERAKAEMLATFAARNARNNGTERLGPEFMVSVATDRYGAPPQFTNLSNLRIDPSVPVFVNTGALDERFYLDLNRNGLFEETGFVPLVVDQDGNPVVVPNTTTWAVGDPQWLGLLQDPTRPHGGDNRFIARYAFAIVPIGRGLDLNWIHNQAIRGRTAGADAYFRNQGFGTYEINLAAFLTDLNTNAWPGDPSGYRFDPDPDMARLGSQGLAFLDARELLNYRYDQPSQNNFTPNTLYSINQLFPSVPFTHFGIDPNDPLGPDWIDGYANGPVMPLGGSIYRVANAEANDNPNLPWPGSDGPRHYFTLHDLFDKSLPNGGFTNHLAQVSGKTNTYDRYTYYRLLSQLGTDGAAEESGKININYRNNGGVSAGQFVNWEPIGMFTNIANRLLRDDFGFGVGRIPIFTNNSAYFRNFSENRDEPVYGSRIQQILQMAANICDATYSNKYENPRETFPYYPSVFRPLFELDGKNIYIKGYEEVTDATDPATSPVYAPWHSLDEPADRGNIRLRDNVYGIPLIIGARTGLPNFNELVVQTAVDVARKLQFVKRSVSDRQPAQTNQMFIMGISNSFGLEVWYPYKYTNSASSGPLPYPRALTLTYSNAMITTLTNDRGLLTPFPLVTRAALTTNIASLTFTGGLFVVPPIVSEIALTNSVYYQTRTPKFQSISHSNDFEIGGIYTNVWGLTVTNRFHYFLVDNGHIIDAVGLVGANTFFNISEDLNKADRGRFWVVSRGRQVVEGVEQQILASLGEGTISPSEWDNFGGANPSAGNDKPKSIDAFRVFVGRPNTLYYPTNQLPSPTAVMQAPFTPSRRLFRTTTWQANDPLVHYRTEDLRPGPTPLSEPSFYPVRLTDKTWLGRRNVRYAPWSGAESSSTDSEDYNTAIKDAGIASPNDWDFPAQKFPNIGWLGRVHRGTPWQTIYFKSAPASVGSWRNQAGGAYSVQTFPTNDWRLVDVFTVAIHPNQTRGRLSINQTNLAAWSAVFSGIQVTTIADDGKGNDMRRTNAVIEPAAVDLPYRGTNSPLLLLVAATNGINSARARKPTGQFTRLGDILSVPALTDQSPFLTEPFISTAANGSKLNWLFPATDSDYERIPQQILSLLRLGEARYVVYAWGQSLKPSGPVPGIGPSIITSGADKGLCKNYQVTGEMATRAVVRVDFEDELVVDAKGNVVLDNNRNPIRTGRKDYRRPHAVVESFNIIPVD